MSRDYCIETTNLPRRLVLQIPALCILAGITSSASAIEDSTRKSDSASSKSSEGEGKINVKDSPAVGTSQNPKEGKDSSKISSSPSSLAMKECDTPPKTETKKQEICEVDY
jgi:hypothetical protein